MAPHSPGNLAGCHQESSYPLRKTNIMLLFGITILGVAGLAMLWGAWHMGRETRAFMRTAIGAPGVVVELKESRSHTKNENDTIAYYPIVSFTSREGKQVTFTSDTAVDQYACPVGEPIKVLYDPAHPDQAWVVSFDSLQGGPVALTVMGIVFSGAALLVFFLGYLNKTPDTATFVAVAFGLTACLLLTGGWYFARDGFYLRAHGCKTTGVVLNSDQGTLIEFTTQDGRTRKFHTQVTSNPPKYAAGDKVPVIYDPAKPGRVRIDSLMSYGWSPAWLVAWGWRACSARFLRCL